MATPRITVTYAGVPFHLPDALTLAKLSRHMPVDYLPDLGCVPPDWPGAWATMLGLPRPPAPPKPLGIGDFFYPCGASRCAVYRGLMTGRSLEILNSILDASTLYVRRPRAFKVEAHDGTGTAVETPMHMLPPRACAEFDTSPDRRLYLVTLVDERFFWGSRPGGLGGGVGFQPGPGAINRTWAWALDYIEDALGIDLATGTIQTAYGPGPDTDGPLYSQDESIAPKLEMLAFCLGRGLVRALAGTYTLQKWADATHAAVTSQIWGGYHTGGGPGLDYTMVPEKVEVHFRELSKWKKNSAHHLAGYGAAIGAFHRPYGWAAEPGGPPSHADHTVTVRPLDLGPPYAAYPLGPRPKPAGIRTSAVARLGPSGIVNGVDCNALAQQLARDYLDFVTTPRIDRSLPGVVAVTPTASADVLWSTGPDGPTTRVVSVPWDWYPFRQHHLLLNRQDHVRSTCDMHETGFWAQIVLEGPQPGPGFTWKLPDAGRAESWPVTGAADNILGGSNAFQVATAPGYSNSTPPHGAIVRMWPDRFAGTPGIPDRYWFDWRAYTAATVPPPPPPPAACGGSWGISPTRGQVPLEVTLTWNMGAFTTSLFIDWGDGTSGLLSLFSGSITKTYTAMGVYDARLTWTCSDGPGGFGIQRVQVDEGLPEQPDAMPDFEPPGQGEEEETLP